MSKQPILSQIYGYAVCLVTLMILIFGIPSIIRYAVNLSDITHSSTKMEKYVSFEKFKLDFVSSWNKTRAKDTEDLVSAKVGLPDDQTLRVVYEAEKADEIARSRHYYQRRLISYSILMLIALGVFIYHWRWVRKLTTTV